MNPSFTLLRQIAQDSWARRCRRGGRHRQIRMGTTLGTTTSQDERHRKRRRPPDRPNPRAISDKGKGRGKGKGWEEAFAGAVSGAVSRVVVAPLDVIKIRFQVQREAITSHVRSAASSTAAAGGSRRVGHYRGIGQAMACVIREEGVVGLWRGTVPGLLLTVPYTAVQFFALDRFKRATAHLNHPTSSDANKGAGSRGGGPLRLLAANPQTLSFVGGSVAGVAATIASYPFDLLRTTMAAQGSPPQYPTLWHAARGLVASKGVARGLYSGMGVTLIEIVPYSALQFGLYDVFSRAWSEACDRRGASTAAFRDVGPFVSGLAAGLCSKFATHPLDVAKKRYQVAGLVRAARYGRGFDAQVAFVGLARLLGATWREEGLRGLFKGVTPSLLKAGPSAALTFAAYSAAMHRLKPPADANG